MISKISCTALIIMIYSFSFAQMSIGGITQVSLQNSLHSVSDLRYFGNTDLRVYPEFYWSKANASHLHNINLGFRSSQIRIIDSAYFHSQFVHIGYSRLTSSTIANGNHYYGLGADIGVSLTQTQYAYTSRDITQEYGFSEIIKLTLYVESRMLFEDKNTESAGIGRFIDFN